MLVFKRKKEPKKPKKKGKENVKENDTDERVRPLVEPKKVITTSQKPKPKPTPHTPIDSKKDKKQ